MAYFKKTDVNIADYTPSAQPYVSQNSTVRISPVTSKFEGRFSYGQNNEFWEVAYSQNAVKTYLEHELGVSISTTNTAPGSGYYHISKPIFFYQPDTVITGSTAVLLETDPGTLKFWGFGSWKFNDIRDGFFLENYEGTIQFVKFSSANGTVVKTVHTRNQWKDPMDGTGPSGLNLDFNKIQMAEIEYSWYGAGSAVLSFKYEGKLYTADIFAGANNGTLPIIGNPNLSMMYGVKIVGTASEAPILKHWGVAVTIDGERQSISRKASVSNPSVKTNATSSSWVPILSIRLKDNFSVDSGFSKSNLYGYINQLLANCSVLDPLTWKTFALITDPTLVGASYQPVPNGSGTAEVSIVEYDSTATSLSGGRIVSQLNTNSNITLSALRADTISLSSMSVRPVITIAAKHLTGTTTAPLSCSFTWEEVY